MTANELRIGNLVLWNGNTIAVESIYEDKVNVFAGYNGGDPYIHGLDCGKIESIPLSPEILESCGFVKETGDYFKDSVVYNNKIRLYQHDNNDYSLYGFNECKVWVFYLHELQNLFALLTGAELSINLEKVKA